MSISILGAGAFGTSLAIALAKKSPVVLWARDPQHVRDMQASGENTRRLAGAPFPSNLTVTSSIEEATQNNIILVALPLQLLGDFLQKNANSLDSKHLIACSKGIDRTTGEGPVDLISRLVPNASSTILTGPSFAADIAHGLPTALSIACLDEEVGVHLQAKLSTPSLRLYRSNDIIGAQLGGALKNVIAIACGAAIGAKLGDSARAALMTRGFAEMHRFAIHFGADPQTLSGLSGFGDLVLTCTSKLSRNYRYGFALGAEQPFDQTATVEGAATSLAIQSLCEKHNLDMPITQSIAAIVGNNSTVRDEMDYLLSRPLKEE
jgi:glycerol-3-phosphate dehydrogenase (NAD(P)+)